MLIHRQKTQHALPVSCLPCLPPQDLDLGLAAHSGVGEQEAASSSSGDGRGSSSGSGWSVSRLAAARHVLQVRIMLQAYVIYL